MDRASAVATAFPHVPPLLFLLLLLSSFYGQNEHRWVPKPRSGAGAAGTEKSAGKSIQREMGTCIWQGELGEGRTRELNVLLAPRVVSTAQGCGGHTKVCRLFAWQSAAYE